MPAQTSMLHVRVDDHLTAATFPRPFVPIAELPSTGHRALDPARDDAEFIAKQVAVLDARRRQGMNLSYLAEDGRILRIAPDGTETDMTAELDREVELARAKQAT